MEKGCPKSKLVIGMPTYGRGFKLADPSNHSMGAAAEGTPQAGPLTSEAGFIAYYEVRVRLCNASGAFISLSLYHSLRAGGVQHHLPKPLGIPFNHHSCMYVCISPSLSVFVFCIGISVNMFLSFSHPHPLSTRVPLSQLSYAMSPVCQRSSSSTSSPL